MKSRRHPLFRLLRPQLLATLPLVTSASAVQVGYQYYRFTPIKLRNDVTTTAVQLSEFDFLNGGVPISRTGVVVTNPGGSSSAAEASDKLVDGSTATKWLDGNKGHVVFNFGSTATIDGYRFTTANDQDIRDPLRWIFEGSTDGITWTLLDHQTSDFATPTARLTATTNILLPTSPAPYLFTWTAGVSNDWNTTTGNWDAGLWNNNSLLHARFTNATPATVNLTEAITARKIEATGDACTLQGSSISFSSIRATGAGATTISNTAPLTIASAIIGTNGWVKSGSGNLTFTGANTYAAPTNILEGSVTYGTGGSYNPATNSNLRIGGNTGRGLLTVNTTGVTKFGATRLGGDDVATHTGKGAFSQAAGDTTFSTAYFELGVGIGAAGALTDTYGGFELSGGKVTIGGGTRVGCGGLGSFHQTGGEYIATNWFAIGASTGSASFGTGVATFSGGTANTAGGARLLLCDRENNTGTLNIGTQAGGNAVVSTNNAGGPSSSSVVLLANNKGLSATVNLNSGTLRFNGGGIARNGTEAGRTAAVNLNGGTLQANSSTAYDLIVQNASLPVTVFNGGLKVDTQGFNATLSSNLLATTGNGIYPAGGTIAVPSNGGSGYIGAPLVTVATVTGTGAGASAIATITGGVITNVTLTCPGQNYQVGDQVSFAFAGGGALTAATTYTYTLTGADLAANGTGGLVKLGSGKLTLTGTNTYTGGTLIEGTLALGSTGALGSSGLISMNGGTLQFSATNTTDYSSRMKLEDYTTNGFDTNGFDVTFASALQVGALGNASLNKLGAGILTLAGSNVYTDTTTVTAGTLRLDYSASNTSKLADASVLKLAGGNIILTGGSHAEVIGGTEITAAGAVTVTRSSGGATLQLGYISRNGTGTLDIAAAGIARTTTPNDGSGKLPAWITVAGQPASSDVSGNIVVYSNYVNVNRLGGKIANDALANVRIVNGGSAGDITPLASGLSDISTLLQNATAGPATITLGGSDILRLGMDGAILVPAASGALTIQSGTLTAGGTDDTPGQIAVDADGHATIASTIADNGVEFGPVTLSKAGTGSLTLAESNTYTGGTVLTDGQLRVNHFEALGSGPITIVGGGLDNTSGAPIQVSASLPQTWDGDFSFAGTNDLAFDAGAVTVTGNRAVTVNAGTLAIGGAVSGGAFTLTKNGAGTLLLANCGLTGLTTVNGGTLEVQARANGDVPYVVNQGATLRIGYTTGGGAATTNIKLNGDGVAATSGLYLEGGTTYNSQGVIELLTAPTTIRQFGTGLAGLGTWDINGTGLSCSAAASGSVIDPNIEIISRGYGMSMNVAAGSATATGDLVINGPLNVNSAGFGLYKRGAGSLVLNATATTANSGLRIEGGSVITGIASAIGENADLSISAGAKLVMNGFNQAAAALAGAGQVVNGSATPVALTLKQGTAQTFSGVLGGAGTNESNFSLVKTGTAKLTLSGANTYGGSTTVSDGTLAVTTPFFANGSDVVLSATAALELATAATDVIDELIVAGVAQTPGVYGAVGSGAQFERAYLTGSGKLSVTTASASSFGSWAASKGLDGTPGKENGPTDDPEKDGIDNQTEFYLDGNPLANDPSILPEADLDDTYLVLEFTRRDDARDSMATQAIQYGGTLGSWTTTPIGIASSVGGNGVIVNVTDSGATDEIEVKIPRGTATKLFARLQVIK